MAESVNGIILDSLDIYVGGLSKITKYSVIKKDGLTSLSLEQ
jgi:hypothetical protein